MEIVVGVLGIGLMVSVGFGCYHWADAKASRRMVVQYRSVDPSGKIVKAYGDALRVAQEFTNTVTTTIGESLAKTLGLDRVPEEQVQPELYVGEDEEGAKMLQMPDWESDPYFNTETQLPEFIGAEE